MHYQIVAEIARQHRADLLVEAEKRRRITAARASLQQRRRQQCAPHQPASDVTIVPAAVPAARPALLSHSPAETPVADARLVRPTGPSRYRRPVPGLRLRPAVAEDAEAIATIWYAGWREAHLGHVPEALVAARTPESFRARADQRLGDTVVAVADASDEVVGFVMVVGDEVEQVYVSADHRGSGVAGLLLAKAERLVAAAGYGRAWLAVVAGNARARRFYQRCGWADEGLFNYAAAISGGTIAVSAHRYVSPACGVPIQGFGRDQERCAPG